MSLEHWFRLSQYLTLGLSCTALVFAEAPFLPELQLCLAPVLALLLLAWWVEGRWSLPNWGANILGLLIAAGGVTWLMTQLSDDEFVLAHLPLHLALLPYMGPLSMAALLVKVFRVHDAGHFWHLQGWGLLQIGLGCLLDGGPAFGALMTVYLASDLICLALHYRLAARRQPPTILRRQQSTLHERGRQPTESGKWLLVFSLRWTLLISATALALFLLTPRRDSWSWEPLSKIRTGTRGGSQGTIEEMNLNGTGRIELDDAIALRIEAIDSNGQPKLDLSREQRWRGSVLDWYEHGRWTTMNMMPQTRPRRTAQVELPSFGPHQFILTFSIQPRQAGGLVLAEPIRLGTFPNRLPVIALGQEDRRRLFVELSGTVMSQVPADQRHQYRYSQVVPTDGDPNRMPAENIWPTVDYVDLLKTLPLAMRDPLQDWTVDLLRRLCMRSRSRLPDALRAALANPQPDLPLARPYWEAVGRALTDYLANSGEYGYSLELTRQDRTVDPVVDFLMNTRQGHCERFAAGLALMLRSVGIPARVVKGYRGCESQGEGQYLVRHSHAHAWVEILVPHSSAGNAPGIPLPPKQAYDWLILDATPPGPAASERKLSLLNLWDEVERFCLQGWRSLILEYGGEEQADLWNLLVSFRSLFVLLNLALVAATVAISFALWILLRRLRLPRVPSGPDGDATLYPRLVQILTRYASLRPSFGQTPREYGVAAQALLLERPALAALADLPHRIVEIFYRVRFGRQPLNEAERLQMESELDRLTDALRQPNAHEQVVSHP